MYKDKIVIIFGASSTYGAGDPEGGWVSRLRRRLDGEVSENKISQTLVYNLGISGGTSEDIRKRVIFEAESRIRKDKDTIFIFAGGGNDAAFVPSKQEFRVNPERFAENNLHFIEQARALGGKVIFQNLTPVNEAVTLQQEGRDRSKSNEYVALFNTTLEEVCSTKKIPFIDAYSEFMKAGHLNLLCEDGVHPNSKGHALIEQLLYAKLRELL